MSYKAYITEAIVCGSENRHTSDRSFLLFTREAGMLHATARSVREERSKQRCALQDFSCARLTLVRGKVSWRIAGAEAVEHVYLRAETREARGFIMRTVALLRRVVRGESPHQDIFDDVIIALRTYGIHDIATLELILSLRILHSLGYVAPHDLYNQYLRPTTLGDAILPLSKETKEVIEKALDHALSESQL